MAKAGDVRNTAAWQRERAEAKRLMVDGTKCFRCQRPMYRWQALDYDHVIPVVKGGSNSPKKLSHSSCNRRHGGIIGNKSPKRRFGLGARRLPVW